ncbi:MAG: VOC family protein [Rhodoplanes sp.]
MSGLAADMLTDARPKMGFRSPEALGGSPVQLYVYVEDVGALVERAVAAGAIVLRPVADQSYGDLSVLLKDPFGHLSVVRHAHRGRLRRGAAAARRGFHDRARD